jgi:hypothetical protein
MLAILSACAIDVPGRAAGSTPAPVDGDAWVVVRYAVADDDPAMLTLLPVETAADEALQASGAGRIDGNEVGQGDYDMYFVGSDAQAMWAVLEPILAGAPVPWERVELRDGLEDPDPTVITGGPA